jgi:phytol kinase
MDKITELREKRKHAISGSGGADFIDMPPVSRAEPSLSLTIKKEVFRKTIHMMAAFVPFFYFFSNAIVMISLLSVTLIYFFSEVLRNRNFRIPLLTKVTELAARSRDDGKIVLGPITLSMGIFLSLVFFDYRVAVIAIFALAFGDGVAPLFGKTLRGPRIPFTFGKTVTGTLGCFLVLSLVYTACGLTIPQAILLALFASIVEAFPTGDYDNLLIPVLTGIVAQYFIL